MPAKPPPWKRRRPAKPRAKLTAAAIAWARARAARAGRRYPNLVDNMAAATHFKPKPAAPAKPRARPAKRAKPAKRR